MQTRMDFLRHGEPVGGAKYRGNRIDDPLTEKGWAQMEQGVGDYADWDLILTSPLVRCSAFAQRLAEQLTIDCLVEPELREIAFGAWEGKTKAELRNSRLQEFEAFYADPVSNTPEGAESVSGFYQRISLCLDDVLDKHTGKNILIVAHAGVIRAGITYVLEAPLQQMYRFEVKNGRISRGVIDGSSRKVEAVNICL